MIDNSSSTDHPFRLKHVSRPNECADCPAPRAEHTSFGSAGPRCPACAGDAELADAAANSITCFFCGYEGPAQ